MFKRKQNDNHVYSRRGGGLGMGLGIARGNRCGNGLGLGRGNGLGVNRRVDRNICGAPVATYFKPNGIAVTDLDVVSLGLDEFEALRLKNIEDLDQTESAKKMEISQSTFARTLDSAYKKISDAIINGKAIEIITES